MSEQEAALLSKICAGEITHIRSLNEMELGIYRSFESKGYTQTWISGDFEVLYAAHKALHTYLQQLDEERQQRAEEERQQKLKDELEDKRWRKDARRSWIQWVITTIISLLSFTAGVLAERLMGFIDWIISFFH